jgi:hypothetical protein
MLVLLNDKRLEAALPDMAARTVLAVVAADMARQQPLQPAASRQAAERRFFLTLGADEITAGG